ncbi:MAG: copper amine oxidase N-terminal domain-containing protein [Thermoanaerobacteraceae bacterium]|nr:copper amine oxidase N-terminal domain-containing protein [Thermoanaerobacteraceae bacterium]
MGVGKATATVDGREVGLNVPPVIVNGRTLVPLRFVSEAVKARVGYHAASSMVVVN